MLASVSVCKGIAHKLYGTNSVSIESLYPSKAFPEIWSNVEILWALDAPKHYILNTSKIIPRVP